MEGAQGPGGSAIQALPAAEALNVRASTALTSFWHAVEICVLNSLDAGATEVHIETDFGGAAFRVTDNGRGLGPADLRLLGAWNATSKAAAAGARGEGLAAICAAAVVEVASRAAGAFETHCCVLRAGQALQLKLAADQRTRPGTVVAVRDLFFNRPVQRKAALGAGGAKREVERCREVIGGLALLRPGVTFTLYDRGARAFVVKHIRGRSAAAAAAEFFGGPPPGEVAALAGAAGAWEASGFAARPPAGHPTAARQRIFVNARAVKAPRLSAAVDGIFGAAFQALLKTQGASWGPGGDLIVRRKASNAHAMFILDLRCAAAAEMEVSPGPGGGTLLVADWAPVVKAVRGAVLAAWEPVLNTALLSEAQGPAPAAAESGGGGGCAGLRLPATSGSRTVIPAFYPSHSGGGGSVSAPGRLAASRGAPAAAPSGGGAQRAACPAPSSLTYADRPTRPAPVASGSRSTVLRLPPQLSGPAPSTSAAPDQPLPPLLPPLAPDPQPPNSLMASFRHRRELSRPPIASSSASAALPVPPAKRPRSGGAGLLSRATASSTSAHNAISSDLDVILSTWRNPAMMPGAAPSSARGVLTLEALAASLFARMCPEGLVRDDLAGARALRQVDAKFVPVVAGGGRLLAVLDQHAADERVQLERLRAGVVAPGGGPAGGAAPSMPLPSPQPLRLGADEVPLLEAYGAAAAAWGWRWTLHRASRTAPEALAEVVAVPLIDTRALTATDLRLYLHELAETRGGAGPPSGVVRVLNSRACRSAVKFGDELLPSRCGQLAAELAATQQCFACAHGRPTTAPLVDLVALGRAAEVLQARLRGGGGGGAAAALRGLKAKLKADLRG